MAEAHTVPQVQRPVPMANSVVRTDSDARTLTDATLTDATASDAPTVADTQPLSKAAAGQPGTKRRRISVGLAVPLLVVIAANVAIITMMVGRNDPASTATPHPRAIAGSAPAIPATHPAPAARPGNLATSFGEGKFVVGKDISPGTYRTAGKSGELDCYWARLTNTGGATNSIIANNLGPGPVTVTISRDDGAFQTRWCSTWTKVG
ncbi:MAG TPA: hypothetical protein VGL88_02805 [Pseudonocardiaceae bacterium]